MVPQDRLRNKIKRGYRVILTVGLVAPALTRTNHASVVSYAEPRRHNAEKLSVIAIRAKVCAAGFVASIAGGEWRKSSLSDNEGENP